MSIIFFLTAWYVDVLDSGLTDVGFAPYTQIVLRKKERKVWHIPCVGVNLPSV